MASQVPTFAYEKRLSRIETLRLAITYISFMSDIMAVPDNNNGKSERGTGKMSHSHQNNSNNHGHHFGMNNGNSLTGGSSGGSSAGSSGSGTGSTNPILRVDCHQNQNVPPQPIMSPFTPLGRMYSPHHPPSAYLPTNIHH